jgi:hypothetical protein
MPSRSIGAAQLKRESLGRYDAHTIGVHASYSTCVERLHYNTAHNLSLIARLCMASQFFLMLKRLRLLLVVMFTIAGIIYYTSRPSFGLKALDGGIRFALEEFNQQFTLHVWTQADHYSSSNTLRAEQIRHTDQQIEIAIYGIRAPGGGQTPDAIPLHWETPLGTLSGTIELTFVYGWQRDLYTLSITSDRIEIQGPPGQFTLPDQLVWQRLPSDTIWVLSQMHRDWVYPLPTEAEVTTYRHEAMQVLKQIEAQGCVRFIPNQGFYTHRDFLAPWPAIWRQKEGFVEIPGGPTRDIGAASIQPTVTFLRCGVHVAKARAIVAGYANPTIVIGFYGWSVEPVVSWGS